MSRRYESSSLDDLKIHFSWNACHLLSSGIISSIIMYLFFWTNLKANSEYKKWVKLALYQLMFILGLTLYFVFVLWAYLATLDNFSPR